MRRGPSPGCKPPRPPNSGPGVPGIPITARKPRGDALETPRGPPSPTLRRDPPQEARPAQDRGPPILLDGPIKAIGLPGCLRLNLALLELPGVHFAAHVAVERISGPPLEDVVRVGASLEVRFQVRLNKLTVTRRLRSAASGDVSGHSASRISSREKTPPDRVSSSFKSERVFCRPHSLLSTGTPPRKTRNSPKRWILRLAALTISPRSPCSIRLFQSRP